MALTKTDLKAIDQLVENRTADLATKESLEKLATKEFVQQGFDKMAELISSVETNLTKEIRDLKKVVDIHSIEIMQLKAKTEG